MGGSRRVPLPLKQTRPGAVAKTRKAPATARSGAAKAARTARVAVAVKATYVYCVVRAAKMPTAAGDLELLPGGGKPRVIPLTAKPKTWLVVADVPLKAFGQDALNERLQDVDWMSRCGVAHQSVMDAFLDSDAVDAVVPMTLFTIFANDDRAVAEATKDAPRLRDSLDRVAGRVEWVVRVLRGDASTGANAGVAAAGVASAGAAPRSGREFLQAKVTQRQAARRAAEETGQAVSALMTALSDVADDVSDRTESLTTGTLSSSALLDAAFLVPRITEHRFEEAARRLAQPLADRGFRVSVTGPWPCYSFVAVRPQPPRS